MMEENQTKPGDVEGLPTSDPDADVDRYPPEPTEPTKSECCGTGCTPCVFDIYDKQLSQWKLQCNAIRQRSPYEKLSSDNNFLTQEEYKTLKIVKIFKETEHMKIYRFLWPDNTAFPVSLGQHILLKRDGVSRQYSILRVDPCCFDILIKIYTTPTEESKERRKMLTPKLDELAVGDEILARGPFGHVFDYTSKIWSHVILIAAGTGICTMYRIIESILNNDEDETRIKLLFSCSTLQDIPLSNKFKEWSSFWNFEVVYFVPPREKGSDENQTTPMITDNLPYYGMKIVPNRLDLDHLREQIKRCRCQLDTSIFVICGTKPFEKDVINHLSKIGVDSSKMILF